MARAVCIGAEDAVYMGDSKKDTKDHFSITGPKQKQKSYFYPIPSVFSIGRRRYVNAAYLHADKEKLESIGDYTRDLVGEANYVAVPSILDGKQVSCNRVEVRSPEISDMALKLSYSVQCDLL